LSVCLGEQSGLNCRSQVCRCRDHEADDERDGYDQYNNKTISLRHKNSPGTVSTHVRDIESANAVPVTSARVCVATPSDGGRLPSVLKNESKTD
jgi:hypothetical protein